MLISSSHMPCGRGNPAQGPKNPCTSRPRLSSLLCLRRGDRKVRACTSRVHYGTVAAACTGEQCAWAELHRIAGLLEDTRSAVGRQALGVRAGCPSCGDS